MPSIRCQCQDIITFVRGAINVLKVTRFSISSKNSPTFRNSGQYWFNFGMALLFQGIQITLILSLPVIEGQTRKVKIYRQFTDEIDLPNYMCRQTNATTNINRICGRMKAITGTHPAFCYCFCPYQKSTFYERKWKCEDNRKIRKAEGKVKTYSVCSWVSVIHVFFL